MKDHVVYLIEWTSCPDGPTLVLYAETASPAAFVHQLDAIGLAGQLATECRGHEYRVRAFRGEGDDLAFAEVPITPPDNNGGPT